MKKLILATSLTLITLTSFGQWLGDQYYILNFDDTTELHHLRIDSLTNHNNLWQIGALHKTIFNNAFTIPNVIVTDTSNPYPVNDTSAFTIVNIVSGYGWQYNHTASLQGEYFVDTDTLNDFGTIEFSPDNGTSWYDIVNDTFITNRTLFQGWITLTGNSNGWQPFFVNLAPLGQLFNVQLNDTILFRFTFISDNIQTNKDGIMFDDLHFEDYFEGIDEIQDDDLISVFPNPTSGELRIQRKTFNDKTRIQIYNYTGEILYENQIFTGDAIDTRQFRNGIYLLKYSDLNRFSIKMFEVQH